MREATWAATLALAVALGAHETAQAQEVARPSVPQIVTSAQGEVRVPPDRATIIVGVQTRAATAAEAAQQNSRKQRAIIEAIKARGVPAEQIATTNFNVIPETRYDREGGTPRVTSYLVMNDVTVELKRIDQVGPVIDAALAAGANQINSLTFGISAADSARRAALSIAVGKARADAEAMARAAGGSIGQLIELTAAEVFMPPPRPMMFATKSVASAEAVPVEPGEQAVRASVTARWQYLATPR